MSIFDEFNKAVDVAQLAKDAAEAESNKPSENTEEVPFGKYEVKIEKMEIKASSKGKPMLSVWFRIVEGSQKNRLIFMNQVIEQGFQIGIVNKFLRSLDVLESVEFTDYSQYNDLVMDAMETISSEGLEYLLNYTKTKNGFPAFYIDEVYEK